MESSIAYCVRVALKEDVESRTDRKDFFSIFEVKLLLVPNLNFIRQLLQLLSSFDEINYKTQSLRVGEQRIINLKEKQFKYNTALGRLKKSDCENKKWG